MKNFEKANAPGFGEPITDCYIEDMEAILKTKLLVLQIFKNYAVLKIVDDDLICKPNALIPLHEHSYPSHTMWANFHCTIDKPDIIAKTIYRWDYTERDDPYRIIWFDHDLGDLVVDRCSQQQFDDWGLAGRDAKIGSDVYFYYIT